VPQLVANPVPEVEGDEEGKVEVIQGIEDAEVIGRETKLEPSPLRIPPKFNMTTTTSP